MSALVLLLFTWLLILQLNHNELKGKVKSEAKKISSLKADYERLIRYLNKRDEQEKEKESTHSAESKAKIEPRTEPGHEMPSAPQSTEKSPIGEKKQNTGAVASQFVPESPSKSVSFEKMFMENIFNKIGAIALVIGLGFFIKLVSPYITFTPPMQITTGFLAGLGMVFGSVKLHKDKIKNYAEVLMGAGLAVLFISTYCGCSFYNLIPIPIASIIGVLLILASYFIAQKYTTFSTIAIGLVGGYFNPFFINSGISANSLNFLFGYFIFLNLVSIVYVYRNQDKIALNFINLILTTFTISIFALVNSAPPMLILPLVLWFVYLVNDMLSLLRSKEGNDANGTYVWSHSAQFYINRALSWLNFGVLVWFANVVFKFEALPIGITVLTLGFAYLACSYFMKSERYLYTFLASVLISTYFLTQDASRVCAWSVEAVIIVYAARKFNLKSLENWGLTFLSAAFAFLFFVKDALWVSDISSYTPILNTRTVLFAFPTLSALLSSQMLAKQNEKVSQLLKFFWISMLYLFSVIELNLILSKFNSSDKYAGFVKTMTSSIVGFIYAINMRRLGELTKYYLFNFASYLIYSMALFAVVASCVIYPALIPIFNIRTIAFSAAIATSLLYAKWSKEVVFFKYVAIFIGLLLIHCETAVYDSKAVLSTMYLLYSGTIMLIGTLMKSKPLKLSGIWITIFAIVKVVLFDLANVDAIYKILVFLSLGVILMIVSYFYTKNKD